ncbi:MAG: ComF family protein [Muribaculaceae bacterium]|nr:ComF family protein [Muribaculaceae bacterium]
MAGGLRLWIEDVLGVIYPNVCEVCGVSLTRGEETLCLHCHVNLPRTNVHRDGFNVIHQRLAGKVPIERAGGYFYYYRESDYAALIHRAKYNGRPVIAERLGERYAREISGDGFFDGVDVIIPVPLHRLRLLRRGYNQSEAIARGVSKVTGLPVGNNLVARRGHSSQTRKNSYERWINAQNIYEVIDPGSLQGMHILVVDDVVTTGATLLACCEAIHDAQPSARISVLTLGVTHLR